MGRRADHARRYQARFRPHARFILAQAGFAALFVALVLSAFHAPAPHDLPVGIVAPAAVTGQVEDALSAGRRAISTCTSTAARPRRGRRSRTARSTAR